MQIPIVSTESTDTFKQGRRQDFGWGTFSKKLLNKDFRKFEKKFINF